MESTLRHSLVKLPLELFLLCHSCARGWLAANVMLMVVCDILPYYSGHEWFTLLNWWAKPMIAGLIRWLLSHRVQQGVGVLERRLGEGNYFLLTCSAYIVFLMLVLSRVLDVSDEKSRERREKQSRR
jgi:hypothetical protein